MLYFCNYYKDDPGSWTSFNTKEELENYIKEQGGCFTIREDEKFNPKWIDEEIETRINEI